MSIIVFWMNELDFPCAREYGDFELTAALKLCEDLRKEGTKRHITISSELMAMVGKPGVDSVVDGKTPDGVQYDWKKRR